MTAPEAFLNGVLEAPPTGRLDIMSRPNHREAENRQFEQPWHRPVALMLAKNISTADISTAVGKTTETINELRRTPWFNKMVTDIIYDNGGQDLLELMKAEVLNSHNVMVQLRDDAKVSPVVRLNAAKTLIEQVMGRAVQRIETNTTVHSGDAVAEVEALEAENERLRHSRVGGLS